MAATASAWVKRERFLALLSGGLALLLFLAASPFLSNQALSALESGYADPYAETQPFDAIFVLGGGTALSRSRVASLGGAGDRVLLAARLYKKGLTKMLVASGSGIRALHGERNLAQETATLWSELDIPAENITQIPEPVNTKQEIIAYKKLVDQRGYQRVGLVSSASHLRRALAQCKRQGLSVVPLPAHYRTFTMPFSLAAWVPMEAALDNTTTVFWEMIGAAVGR